MEVSSIDELTIGVSFLDRGGKNGWVVISSFPAARHQKFSRAFNDKIWSFSCSLRVLNIFQWIFLGVISLFQHVSAFSSQQQHQSFRSVLGGKLMWITTAAWPSFPTIATEGVARCKSARLVARSHWLLSAVKEDTTNRPRCCGEGFQPKVTSQCYMVMPLMWIDSTAKMCKDTTFQEDFCKN